MSLSARRAIFQVAQGAIARLSGPVRRLRPEWFTRAPGFTHPQPSPWLRKHFPIRTVSFDGSAFLCQRWTCQRRSDVEQIARDQIDAGRWTWAAIRDDRDGSVVLVP